MASSHDILSLFFPTALAAADALSPGAVARALAAEPPAVLHVAGLRVRLPLLLPIALLGVATGLLGYRAITAAAAAAAKPRRGGSKAADAAAAPPAAAAAAWWAHAFLYFAGMNASAIMCHCLAAPYDGALARAFVALDVAFTGCSSLSLIMASRASSRASRQPSQSPSPSPSRASSPSARAAPWLWLPVCAATLAGNLLFPSARWGLNEAVYLLTTNVAAGVLFANDVLPTPPSAPGGVAVRLAAAGAAALFAGARADAALHAATAGWLGAAHVAFAACDVAFAALLAYVLRADGKLGTAAAPAAGAAKGNKVK